MKQSASSHREHSTSRSSLRTQRLGAMVLAGLTLAGALFSTGCGKEARAKRAMQKGEAYYKAQDYERAEIEYLKAARQSQNNNQAIARLGTIYFREGVFLKALALLRRAATNDPNNLEARLHLGQLYLTLPDQKLALAEAKAILARNPALEEALILLADSSLRTNEVAESLSLLEKLRPQAGQSAGYHLATGTLLARQQNYAAAEAAFQRAFAADPKSPAANAIMAAVCLRTNNVQGAEQFLKAAADLSPLRSSRRIRYADFLMQKGETEAARQVLEETVKKAPDYLPAWMRLADVAMAQNQLKEAETALRRAVAKDPLHYEARMRVARVKVLQGETAKGVAELEGMLEPFGKIPQVRYELAKAYLANGESSKAMTALNQALKLAPDYVEAQLLQAELTLQAGNPTAVLLALDPVTKKHPQVAEAWLIMARAYFADKKPDKAMEIYQYLAKLAPKSPQPQLLIGNLLRTQGKVAEARKAFEKADELAPNNPTILEQLVLLDMVDKQFQAAADRVQKVIQKNPKLSEPKLLLAQVQMAQGNTNAAEATLRQIIEADPKQTAAYVQLSKIYMAGNRKEKALEQLESLAAKNPKSLSTLMLIATIHESAKDYNAARATYDRMLAANPKHVPALNNLAYLYSERLTDLDKALDYANKARDLSPQDPSTADTLGWIYYKRGDYLRALPLIQESSGKLHSNPEVICHLGLTHYMLGSENAARAALAQALQRTNDFVGRAEAVERLAFLNMTNLTAEASAAVQKRLQVQPDDPIALLRGASLAENSGSAEKALAAYQGALKANPKSPAIHLKLAKLYGEKMGNTARAMELAKAAHGLAPEDPEITYYLGQLACRSNDPKWGLTLVEEASRKLQSQPEVLYDLALALYANGRVAEAQTSMRNAVQANLDPARVPAANRFLEMGLLYADPAKASQASGQIQEALKADANYLPALMASGVLQESSGNKAAARKTYERILTLSPVFTPAIRQMAILTSQEAGEEKQSYEFHLKARDAFPQDPDLKRSFGILRYRRGEFSQAAQALSDCARTRTNDAELFFYLGMSQAQLKSNKEATASLRKALALELKTPLSEEANKTLKNLK